MTVRIVGEDKNCILFAMLDEMFVKDPEFVLNKDDFELLKKVNLKND